MKKFIIILAIIAMYVVAGWFAIYEQKHNQSTNQFVLVIFFFILGIATARVAKYLSKLID